MGEAISVFESLKLELIDSRVEQEDLGAMGASRISRWAGKDGSILILTEGNGGCSLEVIREGN